MTENFFEKYVKEVARAAFEWSGTASKLEEYGLLPVRETVYL
jgi:hypothetical protein